MPQIAKSQPAPEVVEITDQVAPEVRSLVEKAVAKAHPRHGRQDQLAMVGAVLMLLAQRLPDPTAREVVFDAQAEGPAPASVVSTIVGEYLGMTRQGIERRLALVGSSVGSSGRTATEERAARQG